MTNMQARCELVNISAGTLALLTGETNYSAQGIIVNRWIAVIDRMPEGSFETCENWQDVLAIVRGEGPAPAPVEVNEIAPDHITAADVVMPCQWSVSSTGRSVWAFYELDGERFRVGFTGEMLEIFDAAMNAAKCSTTTPVNGEELLTILGEAKHLEKREKPSEINPDKQRHGEVPEKWFIGQALEGRSWKILFDGDAGKTRVMFPRKPSTKVLEAVKAAGFYWSPSLKSWNKGLNFRAFRAAEKLHAQLHALTA